MKVLAIATITKPLSQEQREQVMPREVPDTLQLYLEGAIEQFWYRTDKPGVVFLMQAASVEEAKGKIDQLPLVTGGFASYEFLPLGPLMPLGMLIQGRK